MFQLVQTSAGGFSEIGWLEIGLQLGLELVPLGVSGKGFNLVAHSSPPHVGMVLQERSSEGDLFGIQGV